MDLSLSLNTILFSRMSFLFLCIGRGILSKDFFKYIINFLRFTVKLVDSKGKLIENSNRIPLTIGIYSSENPPKYIDANTAGTFNPK